MHDRSGHGTAKTIESVVQAGFPIIKGSDTFFSPAQGCPVWRMRAVPGTQHPDSSNRWMKSTPARHRIL